MNKIVLLKALITVMTLLIFLGMGGVVYGLLFYKKPSAVKKVGAKIETTTESHATSLSLNLPEHATIKDFKECNGSLCLHIQTNGKERIAIVSPHLQSPIVWIYLTETSNTP